jgi:hypothetical protein
MCRSLESVDLGPSMAGIGARAFNESHFAEISLPDEVWIVGPEAFGNSRLSRLIVGPNLTGVSESAFGMDSSIREVHIRSRPFTTQTEICDALNYSGVLDSVKIFVVGGYDRKICGRDVHPEASPRPSRTAGSGPDESLWLWVSVGLCLTILGSSVLIGCCLNSGRRDEASTVGLTTLIDGSGEERRQRLLG